ncbi:hypothetical protein ACHAWT_006292 [Skeletonema menzelii]
MSSNNALDPPEASPVDLLSGEADPELVATASTNTASFTIDDDDDNNKSEADDVPTPLKERTPSSGSQKPSRSGAKMAKLSDKTSKIMNDYQAYLQEIESEFPSEKVISEKNVDQVKESIRSGYQEKFAPPPTTSNLASMTKEYNAPSDVPLRRGWDGDYRDDEEEGTLNMRDHLVTRRSYTHPLLHSKRFKKALCITLSVTAAIIIGVSVSSKKKEENANLPDWEGEYSEIEGEGEGMQQQQGGTASYVNDEQYQEQMSFQLSTTTYQPLFFTREQDKNYPDGSYKEAWEFCGNMDGHGLGYGLCPFAAVCPNGPGSNPMRGVQHDGPSWIPVSDRVDEWVQIADDGKCTFYSKSHADPPIWGVMGGNDDATRNLFCCKQLKNGGPLTTVALTGLVGTSANPLAIEFDRSKDWTGQTYGQAADFCGQKGYSICPFEVICPDGMNHAPSTGLKPGSDGQWAPISDQIHDWVQVGTDIPCTRWLGRHPDPPAWSQTGVGNEEITRYIYCCPGSVHTDAKPSATVSETAATSPATTSTTTTIMPVDSQKTQDGSNAAAETESPPGIEWFDRSTGYKGQTYTDAFIFCMDKVQALPCHYSAICPDGQGTAPFGGYRTSSESWVPIKESEIMENDNAWVSVSPEHACTRYDRIHAAPPNWGITGEGNEEITRMVACCHETQPPTTQPTPKPTPDPTPKPTNIDYIKLAKENFDPVWFHRNTGWVGQTYSAAQQFCRSKSRDLCPLVAVCPGQPSAENIPFGGIQEGVAWVPLDEDNAWIQVGQEDSCRLYSSLYNHPSPEWGLTGEDSESITRHILCCRDESNAVPMDSAPTITEAESDPVPTDIVPPSIETSEKWDNLAVDIFAPQWYTTKDGYTPSTNVNAQSYCKKNGQTLCPMMAYCPSGNVVQNGRSPLLMGRERFPGEVWAPVGDILGDYVQIGTYDDDESTTCDTLAGMNGGKLPSSNLPKLGGVVLCCRGDEDTIDTVDAELGTSNSLEDSVPAPVLPDADPDVPIGENIPDMSDLIVATGYKWGPVWIGRNEGWKGGSYEDAENFCTRIDGQLCPFKAYCPLGGKHPIMPGFQDSFETQEEHYSPIAGFENTWVNVGMVNGDSSTTCRGYDQIYQTKPEWGLTSAQPELKRYILCCMKDGSS